MHKVARGSVFGEYFVGLRAVLSEYGMANSRAGTPLFRCRRLDQELTSRKCSCTPRSPLSAASPQLNLWIHFGFYRVLFEARATNSSNLESNNFRTGDWFDFL